MTDTPSSAQIRTLAQLAGHAGQFRRGYGRSASALVRRGLAKRKFVYEEDGLIAKFAITRAGKEFHLAHPSPKGEA